jgi:activator of HSP90 ATPase
MKTINQTILTQTIIVPATPLEVYEAFVDSEKHTAFTGSEATGNPEVGAPFTAWEGYIFGKFLTLEPGKRLVQEWQTTEWPEGYPPSKFELTFKAVSAGTEITMTHSGIPKEQEKEVAEGWDEFYWVPLKEYFKQQKKKS